MADVHNISKSIVQATSSPKETIPERIELTPWDLQSLLTGPIQKGLLFDKPQPQQGEDDNMIIINNLRTSLSRTLDFFPPLAGRLAVVAHEDDTTSFYIDCNNKGALFVHAVADGVSVSDIVDPTYVPNIVFSFFTQNGVKNIEATSEPILAVQVTELVDGIFVGCTINHCVCDGASFWHFFNSWAEISSGCVNISRPPVFHRWLPDGIDFPIRIPSSQIKETPNQSVPAPYLQRVFHFTKDSIRKLKERANGGKGTGNISSLQALMSHLWRYVSRVKHLEPDTDFHFVLAIGCRPRIQSLPASYFGNAMEYVFLTQKTKQLEEHGLGKTAWQMNKLISAKTEEKLIEFLESWSRSPKFITQEVVVGNFLYISSSPRFNVYGNDFGWGKPVAVRSGAANKSDGKITVFSGVEEGSIDIEACLLPETLEALDKEEDFMAAQTI